MINCNCSRQKVVLDSYFRITDPMTGPCEKQSKTGMEVFRIKNIGLI